jgi:polar amino acid transport system substrate-binding protein
MSKLCTIIVVLALASLYGAGTSKAENFEIFTAIIPPYTSSLPLDAAPTGVMIEIVMAAFAEHNLSIKTPVRNLPWSRSQQLAAETANSIIIPFARTAARDPNYKWISIILDEKNYIYTKIDSPALNSLNDLKLVNRIGVLAGSAQDSISKQLGLEAALQPVPSNKQNFEKLALGRIDAAFSQGLMAFEAIQELPEEVRKTIQRGAPVGDLPLWAATSLNTSDAVIEQARAALIPFLKTKQYQDIIKKYQ